MTPAKAKDAARLLSNFAKRFEATDGAWTLSVQRDWLACLEAFEPMLANDSIADEIEATRQDVLTECPLQELTRAARNGLNPYRFAEHEARREFIADMGGEA